MSNLCKLIRNSEVLKFPKTEWISMEEKLITDHIRSGYTKQGVE